MYNKYGHDYGDSALSATIKIEGLNELLDKVEKAGNDIDAACREAINACTPLIVKEMKSGAEKHRLSGEVVDNIEATKAVTQRNFSFARAGIDLDKHPEAFEAVYEEYGDGHSPEFPDKFIQPAVDDNKTEVRRIQRRVLKEKGLID